MEDRIESILKHDHAEIDVLLVQTLRSIDSGETAEALSSLDWFWARLAIHIRAEHRHLFPAILNAQAGHVPEGATSTASDMSDLIARLHSDHDFFMQELKMAVKSLRASEELRTVRSRIEAVMCRLAEHNFVEENEVYKRADELLAAGSNDGLASAVRADLKNLPLRFRGRNSQSETDLEPR